MNTPITENKLFLPASVVVAGLLIAGAIMWNDNRPSPPLTDQVAGSVDIRKVNIEGRPFIGNADAPIVMALWGDYQCFFCKKLEMESMSQIIANYVNTGEVKIVFFDFPFLGEDSLTAAIYNQAVWKLYPEKYFEWRMAMYKAQDESGDRGFGDAESINLLNKTINGIDSARIAEDVATNRVMYETAVATDRAEGQRHGITATPSAIIGKELIEGAYPYARFKAAIDTAR